MATGLVAHISDGLDRHTEVLSHERISFGPGESCSVKIGPPAAGSGCAVALGRSNGHYRVTEFDPALNLTLNGAPLSLGLPIDDGDELRFGDTELSIQFFPVRDLPAVVPGRRAQVAPFIEQAALEAAATARRDDAKVFLREFTRELIREINPSTKVVTLLIVASLVGGLLYLGYGGFRELQRSRELIDRQNEQIGRMKDELNRTNAQIEEADKKSRDIIDSLNPAPSIRSTYGNGVCLIAGSYVMVEPGTGRQLRYPESQPNEDGSAFNDGAGSPVLTPDGNGAPFIADFVGTGFHVGDGFIVTNRHLIVEPWTANENVQALGSSVNARFRVTRLVAFFPGHRQPFPMRLRQSSREDLAVAQVDPKILPPDVPALPLDRESGAAGIGKMVVMMGYPSGEERLLATLPEAESRAIQNRCGSSVESLLTCLADRNYVKPLTTQGHITDLDARSIAYDARNAVGGSGAPLFGQSGRVLGVNYGSFTGIPDTNYAVPVRFLFPLLERAGWKSKDPAEEAESNVNSPAPKDVRTSPPTPSAPR